MNRKSRTKLHRLLIKSVSRSFRHKETKTNKQTNPMTPTYRKNVKTGPTDKVVTLKVLPDKPPTKERESDGWLRDIYVSTKKHRQETSSSGRRPPRKSLVSGHSPPSLPGTPGNHIDLYSPVRVNSVPFLPPESQGGAGVQVEEKSLDSGPFG